MNILFILFLTFAKTDGSPSVASSAAQLPAMINRCGYQSGSAEMLHPRGNCRAVFLYLQLPARKDS